MSERTFTKEELLQTIEEMNSRIEELESRRGEGKWLESSLRRRTQELSERIKELECVHNLLQLCLKIDDPFSPSAEKMLQIIRDGWQYPEVTRVRISWDGREYKSLDFTGIRARQVEPIVVRGKRRGEVEVGYVSEKPSVWQGPFLKEEAKLLRSISLWLSLVIDRIEQKKSCRT